MSLRRDLLLGYLNGYLVPGVSGGVEVSHYEIFVNILWKFFLKYASHLLAGGNLRPRSRCLHTFFFIPEDPLEYPGELS